MRPRRWMVGVALVLVQGRTASPAPANLGEDLVKRPLAQDAATAVEPPGPGGASGQPGSEQGALEPLVGTFKVAAVPHAAPDKPPHLTGTCENRLVFGGRLLLSEWSMGEGESRVEVFSLLGYDRAARQFFAVGVDSRRGSMADLWGSYDPVSRSFVLSGKQRDEATGIAVVYRDLLRVLSADSHVLQVFQDVPGRPPRMVVEVTFTRQ